MCFGTEVRCPTCACLLGTQQTNAGCMGGQLGWLGIWLESKDSVTMKNTQTEIHAELLMLSDAFGGKWGTIGYLIEFGRKRQ